MNHAKLQVAAGGSEGVWPKMPFRKAELREAPEQDWGLAEPGLPMNKALPGRRGRRPLRQAGRLTLRRCKIDLLQRAVAIVPSNTCKCY
jgi:hypothetical protein